MIKHYLIDLAEKLTQPEPSQRLSCEDAAKNLEEFVIENAVKNIDLSAPQKEKKKS